MQIIAALLFAGAALATEWPVYPASSSSSSIVAKPSPPPAPKPMYPTGTAPAVYGHPSPYVVPAVVTSCSVPTIITCANGAKVTVSKPGWVTIPAYTTTPAYEAYGYNATTVVPPKLPSATYGYNAAQVTVNAASNNIAGAGAGLAAVLGAAAYLL